jgi:hypothetical protein
MVSESTIIIVKNDNMAAVAGEMNQLATIVVI